MPHGSATIRLARLFAMGGGVAFAASLATGVLLDRRLAHEVTRDAPSLALAPALALDVALFSLFALHHSVLARSGVKNWLTRRLAPALERSVYVWVASALFAAACLLWRPAPALVYEVSGPLAWLFTAARVAGVLLTLEGAARLDPLELAGIQQAWTFGAAERGRESLPSPKPTDDPPLVARGGYGLVRHPIYLGWILMVWGAPVMSAGRVTFAAISTLYLLVAIPFEERSLRERFGAAYQRYASAVRWRVLPGLY